MSYTYEGVKYDSFDDVPFIKKDLNLYKALSRKNTAIKDKRPEMLQKCYLILKSKGAPKLNLNKRLYDFSDKELVKIGNYLGIETRETVYGVFNKERILIHIEPLRSLLKS